MYALILAVISAVINVITVVITFIFSVIIILTAIDKFNMLLSRPEDLISFLVISRCFCTI